MRQMTRRYVVRSMASAAGIALLTACGAGSNTKTSTGKAPDATVATTASTNVPSGTLAAGAKLTVAATTTQIQDWIQNIGGDRVTLLGILKPNVDPHDYEPSVEDANNVSKANIVFLHGIGLDNFMTKTIKNANSKTPVVAVTEGLTPFKGDEAEPLGDPHVWFDPSLVKQMVRTIAGAMGKVDSANADFYQTNAQKYGTQLDQMDNQIAGIITQVPKDRRKLVTNHDAFRYFAARYDMTIVGAVIPSLSDTAEPSAKQINDLIATIKREQVQAIFAESSANPKVAEQVAKETGIQIVDNLYGDSLGAPGSGAETYIGMMLFDAKRIADALK